MEKTDTTPAGSDAGMKLNRRRFLTLGGAGAALGVVELAKAPKEAAAEMLDDVANQALVTEHADNLIVNGVRRANYGTIL